MNCSHVLISPRAVISGNISSRLNLMTLCRQTADVIAKIGFKMFLGVSAEVGGWSDTSKTFTLTLTENPFLDFVELPPSMSELRYCNLLVGVIKGVKASGLASFVSLHRRSRWCSCQSTVGSPRTPSRGTTSPS